jgi:hypothetical protein
MVPMIALIFGGIFALAGIVLFAKKGNRGKNTIKMMGAEFRLASSSLVLVVLGCGLIFAALRSENNHKTGPIPDGDKTNRFPIPSPEPSPQPPQFVESNPFPNQVFPRTEFETEPAAAGENLDNFLRVTNVAFGQIDGKERGYRADLIVKNTGRESVVLNVTEHFFSLEDSQGRSAKLVYFCCPANEVSLAPGQSRTVQLFFQTSGWHGKTSGNPIFLRVKGFSPIKSIAWELPKPPVKS